MRKSILLALVIALFAVLALPAAAQDALILRYPISPDPEHLNPFTATTIAIATVSNNIYEGLFRLDRETGTPVPHLAESYELSDDQLTYTFNLRQGVMFHDVPYVEYTDGDREFTAEDWVWAAELSQSDDETVSAHPEWVESVVGAAEFKAGEAETISGIEMLDEYTIRLTLTAPNRLFLLNLGVPAVPQEAYEQLGADFGNMPVGTGPFQFVEWQRDSFVSLEANADYWWEGYPKVDGVRFVNVPDSNTALLQYRAGELDFLLGFPTGQRTATIAEFQDEYNELPGLNVRYFGFKMDQGFFAENPLVRQAFAHAFDRDLVWNELMEGARFPANLGYLPPSMIASTPATIYGYDLERAAELLTEAGFPNGEGIPPLQLYVFSGARDELSLPVLQESLRTLGVELEIVVEDASTYWDHIGEDDVLMFLSGWSAGINDPADVFDFLFKDARDDSAYDNPAVTDLLNQALQEFDEDARVGLYQQAHDLIAADSPWIVSAYSKVAWLQKAWVSNFNPGGGGTHTAWLAEVEIDPSMMS
ncbi:MAG: ABC transporter substrate-binding protein [Chloroflexota bacterium]|nr:ABC transporter substrate-binding protein [Chloroflexota bacterium]